MPPLQALLFALALAGLASAQELVSFATEDGGVVFADLYGKGERGVVLAHGGRFNKESWAKQARALEAAGFRVLAIDFRGYGKSRGGPHIKPDAAEASAESKRGEIDRIVLLAAPADAPEKLKGRKLFIVARDDVSGDGPRLPGIRASYEKTPQPKELIILDGSAHAQFLFETDQGERVMHEILRFLSAP